jgi:ABC-type multidrug transport system fused ATPase/permease subunit
LTGAESKGAFGLAQFFGLYAYLSPRVRRDGHLLFALTLCSAAAEFATISAVIPFIGLLASPQKIGAGWPERLLQGAAVTAHNKIILALAVLVGAATVATVLRLGLARTCQRFGFGAAHDLAVELQRRTIMQPYSWHIMHNSSEALASLPRVDSLGPILIQLVQGAAAAVMTVAILALLIGIDPVATMVPTIVLGASYLAISLLVRRRLSTNSRAVGAAYEHRIRILQEALGGIRDLVLDGTQPAAVAEFRTADARFARALASSAFLAAMPRYLLEGAAVAVIAILAVVLERQGGLTPELPLLGALALAAQRLLPLVQQIYQAWSVVAGSREVVGDVLSGVRRQLPDMSNAPAEILPYAGPIELRDVGYCYPGCPSPALRNVNLTIAQGSITVLSGKTGSGKSTLLDLLLGLLEPTDGQILVDGKPLTAGNRQSWQRNIAHVPQFPFLADATIAGNIALSAAGAEPDMERVAFAAHLAHLSSFIETLPQGYDSYVGERGVRLSGGQRQRLAIAGAIYKIPRVLVLDEATSAVDPETEVALLETLLKLREEGCTIIAVAHRGAILNSGDVVVTLADGRVVKSRERQCNSTRSRARTA